MGNSIVVQTVWRGNSSSMALGRMLLLDCWPNAASIFSLQFSPSSRPVERICRSTHSIHLLESFRCWHKARSVWFCAQVSLLWLLRRQCRNLHLKLSLWFCHSKRCCRRKQTQRIRHCATTRQTLHTLSTHQGPPDVRREP